MKLVEKLLKNKKALYIGIAVLLILIVVVLILTSKDEPKNEIKPTTTTTKAVKKKLTIVNEDSNSRPYAVMINNLGVARPLQSGLQDAYIIYEIIVEGGLTRYMALFMDQNTERIGSIRSARHYFLDYALENDAIYVHHGQSPQAQSDFKKLGVDRIEATPSKTGWRDRTLNVSSEHTLFTSIEKLNNGLSGKRTEREKDLLLNYSADEINLSNNAQTANKISIKYSSSVTSSYEYDNELKVYKRFVNGKAHTDYVTEKQYTFKNIIAYEVENTTIAGDDKGRQTLNNIGSGNGYYITNGQAVPITWEKTSRNAQTVYKLLDGKEITVNDGNTFIQIIPKGKTVEIS